MKRNTLYILLLLSAVVLLQGCNNNNKTTYEPSNDPTVASLTFQKNDSFPGLAKAVFTIEERLDTGIIYNVDSLDYGTRIDKVVPNFRFKGSVVSTAILYSAFDTISLSGGDTVNFTVQPVYLQSISETGLAEKWYEIYVNVHQQDPDLYVWEQIADNIIEASFSNQHAVILNDVLYLFASDGLQTKSLRSSDGKQWDEIDSPFSLFNVANVIAHDGKLYCFSDTEVATLEAGSDVWTITALEAGLGFSIEQPVFSFNDSIWLVAIDNETQLPILVTTVDATSFEPHESLSEQFPVSDFAALTFTSKTGRKRAMIVGGFSANGTSLNTRWNVEYDPTKGYHWEDFSIEQPSFASLTGVSVIFYGKKLDQHFFMFGGVDADNKIGEYDILESYDEGMNWKVPDIAHNVLPDVYKSRAHQSVLVDSKNNIYVIGGKSRTEVFTDVYRGKLNSINW